MIRSQAKTALQYAHASGWGTAAERTIGFARELLKPKLFWRNARIRRRGAPDGLPIPPDHLIGLVTGARDVEQFLASGARTAQWLETTLQRGHMRLSDFGDVLDFGCGCGRVLRHLLRIRGTRFHGCDYNRELAGWTGANLADVEVRTNGAGPPLPYPDDSFDFVYAFSVFTHFGADLQHAWMADLKRVLRPGGALLFTVHGRRYLDRLSAPERESFDREELVVRYERAECSNLCAAYHPEGYTRRLAEGSGFELRLFVPGEKSGTGSQDGYLVVDPAVS